MNPHSGGGKTGGRRSALRDAVRRWFSDATVLETAGPGHGTELAAQAVNDGVDLVVAVGGDGTAHEVANGLFDAEGSPLADVVFTVVPAGTGSDYVRTLGTPADLDQAVEAAAHGRTVSGDVIRVRYALPGGGTGLEICINVASFGISGEVVQRVQATDKRLGSLGYVAATVQALLSYRSPEISIEWTEADGAEGTWCGRITTLFAANGAYCGGGMCVGPHGAVDDGVLDMTILPALGPVRGIVGIPRLFNGTIDRVRGAVHRPIVRLEATASGDATVLLELDGEQPGMLPLTLEVMPGALRIRGRRGQSP